MKLPIKEEHNINKRPVDIWYLIWWWKEQHGQLLMLPITIKINFNLKNASFPSINKFNVVLKFFQIFMLHIPNPC